MFSILSGTNSFIANVSTSNQLLKSNPSNSSNGNPSYTGNYVSRVCEQDAGIVLGTPTQKQSDVSSYYRKRVGKSCLIHYTKFGAFYANVNPYFTNNWYYVTPSITGNITTGGLLLNAGFSRPTTASNVQSIYTQSYASFHTFMSVYETTLDVMATYTTNDLSIGCIIVIGYSTRITSGNINSSAVFVPDGIFFKYDENGMLRGVRSIGGVYYMTPPIPIPTLNVEHTYTIRTTYNQIDFIIDGVYYYSLNVPVSILANTTLSIICLLIMIGGASSAITLLVYSALVSVSDLTDKPWAYILAGNLQGINEKQATGVNASMPTLGSTSNYTNSLAVGAGVALLNTNASVFNVVGGQITVLPTLSTATDGILFYVSPALIGASSDTTNKNMVITGVNFQGCITTVLSNPVTYIYYLAYGSVGAGLQTVDDNATIKGVRRIPIGVDTAFTNLVVGTLGIEFKIVLNPPIILYTNESMSIALRNINTVTTTGAITYLVSFDGYWE